MSGQLQVASDDGAERCTFCPRDAAGPCASCRRPVCGDCCTLTEGGVKTWAICLDCDRKKGSSLAGPWAGFGMFLVLILVVLAGAVALLAWLGG
ncbi:MAG: hypothetical protein KF819_00795 [Labilithrix sp.]|nr:hypothetical protein [Labilithrix sp.]